MKLLTGTLLLFCAYLAIRIFFIFTFPPFTDESLYIRWGLLTVNNPGMAWAPLQYISRQPLAFWIMGAGETLVKNPLIGARLVMLLFNIPVFFWVRSVTKKLYPESAVIPALIILTFSPLFILFQSLAIMEGLLFPLSIGVLWLMCRDLKINRWVIMAVTGVFLAIALWIKTTALFIVLMAGISVILGGFKEKRPVTRVLSELGLMGGVCILLLLPLVLRPDFHYVFGEPGSFLLTPSESAGVPFMMWGSNALSIVVSLIFFLNPVIVIFSAAALVLRKPKTQTLLVWWLSVPLILMIFLSNNLVIRYAVTASVAIPALLGAAVGHGAGILKRKTLTLLLLFITAGYGLFFVVRTVDFFRLFPSYAHEQYWALSWPSGYGIPELTRFIDGSLKPGSQLILAVADSPGNPSDYILAYYFFSTNVRVTFATITNVQELGKLKAITDKVPVYLVTRSTLLNPEITPYLIPVKIIAKPYSDETVGIYRIDFTHAQPTL